MPIPIGPYVLEEPIGRGAMGEVWRASTATRGFPVAVKLITGRAARKPTWLESFRHEVRATARLDHPGIVLVLDHGVVDERAAALAARDGSTWHPGSPYLVMEHASGGTLAGAEPASWGEAEALLRALLDALAHAHARGVVHRDLKPGNVLLCGPGDPRPGLKLADFGIAWAPPSGDAGEAGEPLVPSAGTPSYMAPEQIAGQWRDLGPWTDLYALGCLAWKLVTGRAPFTGGADEIVVAQLSRRPPALEARFPVPDGLEDVLRALLAKSPEQRFRRAADVAFALSRLGRASAGGIALPAPAPTEDDTPTRTDDDPTTLPGGWDPDATADAASRAAPLPSTWGDVPPPAPFELVTTSLSLYGLRPVPLAGREAERDELWKALREVHATRSPRVVVVGGPSGTGKSRLVDWVAVRAHELGAADVLRAVHAPADAPAEALRRMLERALRTAGLGPADVRERVRGVLTDPGDVEAVARLLSGEGDAEAEAPGRRATWTRVLAALSAERPLVVCLDDVQWGADALALAEHLVKVAGTSPVAALVLLTARDEALAERPAEAARLKGLCSLPRVRRVDLEPLGPVERRRLLQGLLRLEPMLAARVEERTGGNPLFAVQLIGDWVARGLLRPGSRGLALPPGVDPPLPDDVHAVWSARVAQALAGVDGGREVVERAAVLGQEVAWAEWSAVCGPTTEGVRRAALERLLAAACAERADQGFSFVHPMLRESLERLAAEAGRLEAHHRACAGLLAGRKGVGVAERLGRHLLAAGDLDEALPPLYLGVQERIHTTGFSDALALLSLCREAMDRLAPPPSDERWGRLWNEESWVLRWVGRLDEAAAVSQRAYEAAMRHRWPSLAKIRLARAGIAVVRNEATAPALLDEAVAGAEGAEPLTRALGARLVANLKRKRGDDAGALALFEQSMRLQLDHGDEIGAAHVLRLMSETRGRQGDRDGARRDIAQALAIFERHHSRSGAVYCQATLAEILRHQGRLDEAEDLYRKAQAFMAAFGDANEEVCRLNLGLIALARRRYPEAKAVFDVVLPAYEAGGRRFVAALMHASLLAPCVVDGDVAAFDAHLERAKALIVETGLVEEDVARAAAIGAEEADRRGERERAKQAWWIAAEQYRKLGKEREAQEAEGAALFG